MHEDKSEVEQLKDKLYSRGQEGIAQDIRAPLEQSDAYAPPVWEGGSLLRGPKSAFYAMPAGTKMSFSTKFLIGSAAFFAIAAVGATVGAVLSTAGTVLVVKTVESTARGTVVVLERASDGAAVSVEVLGRGVGGSLIAAGTLVTVSVIGAGVVLSAACEVLAFIPNALGRALLYNERVTR